MEIIRQSQARILQLQQQELPDSKAKRKPKAPYPQTKEDRKALVKAARTRELQLAAVAGEEHELRDSVRVKQEQRSSDDEEEVLLELKPSIACSNMFAPLRRLPTRTKHGYVKSDFIDENSSDNDEQTTSSSDDDDGGDDPNDPDFSITSSTTPSQSRSRRSARKLTKSDADELDAFRKNQATLTASLIANMLQTSQSTHANPVPTKVLAVLDAHGRPARELLPQYDHKTKPPTHGDWDNIDYFMKEYMPLYDKYKATCGTNYFDTIFEGYTSTQKTRISRFLTREINGVVIDRSVEYLSHCTNEEFVKLMCAARGYGTTSLTEIALRKIQFKGPLTERSAWVNLQTDWEECLSQTSKNGIIDKKRLIVIYKECIPDPFFQTNLAQQRFDSWSDAHTHALAQITNPCFLVPWMEDLLKRKPQADTKQRQAGGGTSSGGASAGGASTTPTSKPGPTTFDPATYKDRHGGANINPNMKNNLNLNPSNIVCERCGKTHKWLAEMCTEVNLADGKTKIEPPQSFAENVRRGILRWTAGFFFKSDPKSWKDTSSIKNPKSPTVGGTASDAAVVAKTLSKA